MDGGKRSRIVTNGLTWPNGLAVDHVEKLLFWTDAKVNFYLNYVENVNLI